MINNNNNNDNHNIYINNCNSNNIKYQSWALEVFF